MRIISKFRDYYDGVQCYGQDQDLVYVRNKEYPEENFDMAKCLDLNYREEISLPALDHSNDKKEELSYVGNFILGFCGELYRGVVLKIVHKDPIDFDSCTPDRYIVCYDEESFKPYKYDEAKDKRTSRYKGWYRNRGMLKETDIWEIKNQKELKELFFKYQTPCFIISRGDMRKQQNNGCNKYKGNITLNPSLQKYQFYKVKDAYTCFQDIAMYLGGVLPRTGHEMIEVSNNDLIVKRGFDLKTSFRKSKEK